MLDNLIYGRPEWVSEKAELIRGDITDLEACRKACSNVSGVFHAAAMSRAAPLDGRDRSLHATEYHWNAEYLIAARAAGVRKLIYSGSSTYYGNQPGPQVEDMRPDCLNFYALSKFCGEEYCRLFDHAFNFPTVILRYFNAYGPRQPQMGAYALVLGVFLRRWRDGQPLEIHGAGQQRRDFIHVRDVADCNITAYESPARGVTLNAGSGNNISVKELADLISVNQVARPRRFGDAEVTLADISRTSSMLGWQPRISFADGLAELKDLTQCGLE